MLQSCLWSSFAFIYLYCLLFVKNGIIHYPHHLSGCFYTQHYWSLVLLAPSPFPTPAPNNTITVSQKLFELQCFPTTHYWIRWQRFPVPLLLVHFFLDSDMFLCTLHKSQCTCMHYNCIWLDSLYKKVSVLFTLIFKRRWKELRNNVICNCWPTVNYLFTSRQVLIQIYKPWNTDECLFLLGF